MVNGGKLVITGYYFDIVIVEILNEKNMFFSHVDFYNLHTYINILQPYKSTRAQTPKPTSTKPTSKLTYSNIKS